MEIKNNNYDESSRGKKLRKLTKENFEMDTRDRFLNMFFLQKRLSRQ